MSDLSPGIRKTCLKLLYRTCGNRALLPSNLNISVRYDQTSNALYRGGYADVWKGECGGQDVAVKVIRTYSNDELRKIISVSTPPLLVDHLWKIFYLEILQRGCVMEISSTPERSTIDRGINVGESVHDGIGVDHKWEH